MPTLFSRIIAWEIPSFKIYEDEYVYAFLDIRPVQPGHTLIIPKVEVDKFYDVPEPYYSAVFAAAKRISPAIEKGMNATRIATVIAGYEIPHFHYHLIPTNSLADIDFQKATPADLEGLKLIQENIVKYL